MRIADSDATRTIGATILGGRSQSRAHASFLSHLQANS